MHMPHMMKPNLRTPAAAAAWVGEAASAVNLSFNDRFYQRGGREASDGTGPAVTTFFLGEMDEMVARIRSLRSPTDRAAAYRALAKASQVIAPGQRGDFGSGAILMSENAVVHLREAARQDLGLTHLRIRVAKVEDWA